MSLPPTNFANAEHTTGALRLWVSVSTRKVPREQAMRSDVADGYIVLKDARGARIVADGLGFTNENKLDPSGRWLYVNETMARRLSRFALKGDGLGPRETVAEFDDGIFPDGFEFDAEGGIWIASVVSNRLLRIAPDGSQTRGAGRRRSRGDRARRAKFRRAPAHAAPTSMPAATAFWAISPASPSAAPTSGRCIWARCSPIAHRDFPLADRRRTAAALATTDTTRWERAMIQTQQGDRDRGRAARRFSDRARLHPDRDQDRADQPADRGGRAARGVLLVRVAARGAAAGRCRRGAGRDRPLAGHRADRPGPERQGGRARGRGRRGCALRVRLGVGDPQPQERQPHGRGIARRLCGGDADREPGRHAGARRDRDRVRLPVRGRRAGQPRSAASPKNFASSAWSA